MIMFSLQFAWLLVFNRFMRQRKDFGTVIDTTEDEVYKLVDNVYEKGFV